MFTALRGCLLKSNILNAASAPVQPENKMVSSASKRHVPSNYLPIPLVLHSLLVLRLPALRILWLLWLLSMVVPALRSSLHRNRLPSSSAFHHVLDIRAMLEVLVEFADVAADILVGLEAERYDWNRVRSLCMLCATQKAYRE